MFADVDYKIKNVIEMFNIAPAKLSIKDLGMQPQALSFYIHSNKCDLIQ